MIFKCYLFFIINSSKIIKAKRWSQTIKADRLSFIYLHLKILKYIYHIQKIKGKERKWHTDSTVKVLLLH